MKIIATEKSKISNLSDCQLWMELRRDGDPDMLHTLFYRFYDDLYFYGSKLVKDNDVILDTIQDVFSFLWEDRKSLSDVQNVKAYLFKTFRNKLVKTSQKNMSFFFPIDIRKIPEDESILSPEDIIIDYNNGNTVSNYPPRIKALEAENTIIETGASTRVYCTASDPGQDALTFEWTVLDTIVTGTNIYEFTAPDSTGAYRIICKVTDPGDQWDTLTVWVEVVEKIKTPPMNFIHGKVIKANDGILFTDDSQIFKVNLPSDHLLMKYIEKEVVLGIRSEDIHNQARENKNDFAVLNSEIKFVEKLGHEIYAYIQLQDQQVISRLKYDAEIMKGSVTDFYLDIRKMYFFDKFTGANLQMALE